MFERIKKLYSDSVLITTTIRHFICNFVTIDGKEHSYSGFNYVDESAISCNGPEYILCMMFVQTDILKMITALCIRYKILFLFLGYVMMKQKTYMQKNIKFFIRKIQKEKKKNLDK